MLVPENTWICQFRNCLYFLMFGRDFVIYKILFSNLSSYMSKHTNDTEEMNERKSFIKLIRSLIIIVVPSKRN